MKFNGKLKSYSKCGKGLSLTFYVEEVDKHRVLKNLENFEDKPLEFEMLVNADRFKKEKEKISDPQRKQIFGLVREIADHMCQNDRECMRKDLQLDFQDRTGCPDFSLSDCRRDIARDFIHYLLRFAFENGVAFSVAPKNIFEDDIETYLRICLEKRVCVVCGKPNSDLHHVQSVGANGGRKYNDSALEKICLCRVHHQQAHQVGWDTFAEKYHVKGIIYTGE